MDRVLFSKFRSIERCLRRVREEHAAAGAGFATDWTRQDAAILNLIRGCEQVIDMANRMIRLRNLDPPDEAKDLFLVLERAGLIEPELRGSLQKMVGFRNIAVHEYQLDLEKVRSIIEDRLDDLLAFSKAMLRADPTP